MDSFHDHKARQYKSYLSIKNYNKTRPDSIHLPPVGAASSLNCHSCYLPLFSPARFLLQIVNPRIAPPKMSVDAEGSGIEVKDISR